jgi:hypothetical protein
MQVTLMPLRRNLPYDAYTSISIFNHNFADYPPQRHLIAKTTVESLVAHVSASNPRLRVPELLSRIAASKEPTYLAISKDAIMDGIAINGSTFGKRAATISDRQSKDIFEGALAYAHDRSPAFVAFRGFNAADYTTVARLQAPGEIDGLKNLHCYVYESLRRNSDAIDESSWNSAWFEKLFPRTQVASQPAQVVPDLGDANWLSLEDFAIALNESSDALGSQVTLDAWKKAVLSIEDGLAKRGPTYRPQSSTTPPLNPVVIPLLVTDDIQAAIESHSAEQIRQLALSAAAMAGPANIGGGLSTLDQQLRSVLGRSLDSTFTISRESDNTIFARFGATNQGGSRYAMLPEAHNVTLLVFRPA